MHVHVRFWRSRSTLVPSSNVRARSAIRDDGLFGRHVIFEILIIFYMPLFRINFNATRPRPSKHKYFAQLKVQEAMRKKEKFQREHEEVSKRCAVDLSFAKYYGFVHSNIHV